MRVLIIDDEKSIRSSTSAALRAEGLHADVADGSTVALAKLQEEAYDLAFLDLRLADEDGLNVLPELKRSQPNLVVVVFTAYASVASAVAAMQKGAFDYLEKPFTPEQLRQVLGRVEKQRKLETKIVELQQEINQQNPAVDFCFQLALFFDPAEDLPQLLWRKWLFQVVERPLLHRSHSGSNGSVGRKNYDNEVGLRPLELRENI